MTARRIGIAGYMGAGKSSAARLLSSAAGSGGGGVHVVDADLEAKTLMTADPGIRELLVQAFGSSIIEKNGLSFNELGRIVFSSKEQLLRLNAIVHPPLIRRLRGLVESLSRGRIILDAAVLPLWKLESRFDECLWINAPFEIRLERLKRKLRHLDEHSLRQRMRVQEECLPAPTCPPWRKILNTGSLEDLAEALGK